MLLDAGNALFQTPLEDSETARKKAELILRTMGQLQTAAFVPGARDLNAGVDWLKAQAQKAKLPVLSANLVKDKKPVFEPSRVVTVGSVKVGLIGVSPANAAGKSPGVSAEPPVPAALAEAKKLRGKVDLLVVLAALPYADALQLARDGQGTLDLVLQSNDNRWGGMTQNFGPTHIISGGERGKSLVRVEFDLTGKGPLVDMGGVERSKQQIAFLDQQIAQTRQRMADLKDAGLRKQYEETLKSFEARRAEVAKAVPAPSKDARTLAASQIELDASIQSDQALKVEVEKLQPPTTP